jgi:uncharacterized membrane protein YhaH (DUF805 family)
MIKGAGDLRERDGEASAEQVSCKSERSLNPFSLRGRMGRLAYVGWTGVITFPLSYLGLALNPQLDGSLARGLHPMVSLSILMLVSLTGLWIVLALATRRVHDFNAGGGWVLGFVLAVVAATFLGIDYVTSNPGLISLQTFSYASIALWMILALVLYLTPGTRGDNRFGPPRRTAAFEKVLGVLALIWWGFSTLQTAFVHLFPEQADALARLLGIV